MPVRLTLSAPTPTEWNRILATQLTPAAARSLLDRLYQDGQLDQSEYERAATALREMRQ